MLRNFIKTAIRSLLKNKTYSSLNIAGLATGIACAGLIFLWVESELGYDQFNTKKDRIYFTMVNQKYDAGFFTMGSTPGPLAPAVQQAIPGIANTCRMSENETSLLFSIGDKPVYAAGKYVEPTMFSMFTLPFVQGSAATAFKELYSLVITEKTAKKFFGDDKKIVGRTIRVDNKQDYVVTGILKDIPGNSSLQFEWVAPFQIWYKQAEPWAQIWGNNCLSTYIELQPGASETAVNKQLYGLVQQHAPQSIGHPFLFNMNDWHLRGDFKNGVLSGGGQIQYVRLFSTIAWIILFIACINFMNLATARSEKRSREVGVRKVLGAGKKSLVLQFIGEALLMSAFASVIAVFIMALVLPAFNLLVQKSISLQLGNTAHLLALLAITVVCGLIAGSYPAFYLSSFNPVFVLKGVKLKSGSAAIIRKGLVVLQFSASIILIVGTIVIYQQIQHIKARKLGFDKDRLLEIPLVGDMAPHYQSVKNDLLNTGTAEAIALSDHSTIYGGNNSDGITWQGKTPGTKVLISGRDVTPEFIRTSGIKILEGRDSKGTDSIVDQNNLQVLVTESLAKMMGTGSAIGKVLRNEGDTTNISMTVVGVVNDYVYGNMYGKPDPVIFICMPATTMSVMYLRTKRDIKTETALAKIEAVLKKDNPAYPFEYKFVDDQFNEMFFSEMLIGKLSRVFASLAIIISCLGLFGLAAYTAERRTKEIGVRKVLGANVTGLAALLSKDFMKLVAVSCAIAFPVAWLIMNKWLLNYDYRIEISWWIFVVAGVVAMTIALVTVSFQAIKAAVANPIKSLRTE